MVEINQWIKTDDLQYVKKMSDTLYLAAEARSQDEENTFLLCGTIIDIADYFDENGDYDYSTKQTILSFYGSVDEFHKNYPELDFREQVLVEMLFEEMPCQELLCEEVPAEKEVNEALEAFLKRLDS